MTAKYTLYTTRSNKLLEKFYENPIKLLRYIYRWIGNIKDFHFVVRFNYVKVDFDCETIDGIKHVTVFCDDKFSAYELEYELTKGKIL